VEFAYVCALRPLFPGIHLGILLGIAKSLGGRLAALFIFNDPFLAIAIKICLNLHLISRTPIQSSFWKSLCRYWNGILWFSGRAFLFCY
jgi:hypothetical protein